MFEHHQDSLINLPLAVLIFSMPWWLHFLDSVSWLAATLVPIFAIAVAILQVALLIRKHLHFRK